MVRFAILKGLQLANNARGRINFEIGLKRKLRRIFLLFDDARISIHVALDSDTKGNKERLVSPGHHRIISWIGNVHGCLNAWEVFIRSVVGSLSSLTRASRACHQLCN